MVYTGKPSRGCFTCRARHIKCDEEKPICRRCIKSKRECKGYRNEFDLVLRDQTTSTANRARKRANPSGEGSVNGSSEDALSDTRSTSSSSSDEQDLDGVVVLRSLQPSLDDQAIGFFMSNFIVHSHDPDANHGYYQYLQPMLKTEKHASQSALWTSVLSVGSASLSNIRRDRGALYTQSRLNYTHAINKVSRAIQDPVEAKKDSTLLAVLLLSMYEMVSPSESNLMAWGSHVDGAVALVALRGKDQMNTVMGRRLFATVQWKLVINALQQPALDENQIHDWIKTYHTDGVSDIFTKAILNVPLIRTEARKLIGDVDDKIPKAKTTEKILRIREIVDLARQTDAELQFWTTTLPPDWQCQVVARMDGLPEQDVHKAECYPGDIHVYPDVWVAAVWNIYRSSRIFLHFFIRRCLKWLHSPSGINTSTEWVDLPESQISKEIMQDQANEICASIPFYFGYSLGNSKYSSTKDPKILGGYLLTWPLAVLLHIGGLPTLQHEWVKGRLRHVGRAMGVAQAIALAA